MISETSQIPAWGSSVVSLLIHGTILAGLTWALCRTVLRKVRPSIHAVLWTVVLVKFFFPPMLPGVYSLSGLLEQTGSDLIESMRDQSPGPAGVPSSGGVIPAGTVRTGTAYRTLHPAVPLLLAGLYFAGLTYIGCRSGLAVLRSLRYLRGLAPADAETKSEIASLARKIGLKASPDTRITTDRISPYVAGFLFPRLVVPGHLLLDLSADARAALIVHELAHIRRGDLLVRAFQGLARWLLYFWPPVRWVCREIEKATEMACDQWALRNSRVLPQLYAHSILQVVRTMSAGSRPNDQLAFVRQKSYLEERFKMITDNNHHSQRRISWIVFPALAIWAAFSLAGAGSITNSQENAPISVRIKGDATNLKIDAGLIPEADLDHDGFLSLAELEGFQAGHPDQLMLWVESREGEPTEVQVEVQKVVESQSAGAVAVSTAEGGEKKIFVVAGEHLDADLLASHPEADLDGDGKLSPGEIKKMAAESDGAMLWIASRESNTEPEVVEFQGTKTAGTAAEGEMEVIRLEDPSAGSQHVKIIRRRTSEGAPGEEVLIEVVEGEDVHEFQLEDGGTLRIAVEGDSIEQLDTNQDGVVSSVEAEAFAGQTAPAPSSKRKVFVFREAKPPSAPDLSSEELRRDFLKDHPEADLDGDGNISAEEAKAFAAKSQSIKKPVHKE